MMIGGRGLRLFQSKTVKKKQMIVCGLKKDNYSREMLVRLLTWLAAPGDSVLAVHVEEPSDPFDPNTFHIHEDICKSKQVDYQIKVCTGDSFVAVLINQVRLHHATTLVIGCSSPRPKESVVTSCLKGLPPTCSLLVIDTAGRVLLEKQGTSQQGSSCQTLKSPTKPSLMIPTYAEDSEFSLACPKSVRPTSKSSQSPPVHHRIRENNVKNAVQVTESNLQKQFQKLAILEIKRASRRFTPQELESATEKFNPHMIIGESSNNKVYRANFGNDQDVAVKILQITEKSGEDLLQEVEILSGLNHEYIVHLIGYCYSIDMHAVVHNLFQKSLKQNLTELRWNERKSVAIGVAKALEYLHHSCSPPIIHREVRSANILLSCHRQPQLSGFGAAIAHHHHQIIKKPVHVVETSAYLAPEYLMFGRVNEKVDVYSYGVVLLELITGKEATQDTLEANHESLVLQARALLSRGLYENLIDPQLNEFYDKEEMHRMIMAARLCLMHSSSRRPTMKTILQILEDHEYCVKMQREREEFINDITSRGESELQREDLGTDGNSIVENIA